MIFFLAKYFADIIPKKHKSNMLAAGPNNISLIEVISGKKTANNIIIAKHVSHMLNIEESLK
ncbi:hypothetical protein D515_04524 [Grimontia indica]|uniref:Uncharacterized protein n=1 Tax=Grimontia indica TaxID=1056512 RepID=R1GM41_9GAMM|nr:hypothetical protein D515_04524 [Grimontia indica]